MKTVMRFCTIGRVVCLTAMLTVLLVQRQALAEYCADDPINYIDPLGKDRTLYFNGHRWIQVDTWDNKGNRTGSLILDYGPQSASRSNYYISDPDKYFYQGKGLPIDYAYSNAEQDRELLAHWLELQRKNEDPYNVIPNNCWTASLDNYGYGMTPKAPYIPPPANNIQVGPHTFMGFFPGD